MCALLCMTEGSLGGGGAQEEARAEGEMGQRGCGGGRGGGGGGEGQLHLPDGAEAARDGRGAPGQTRVADPLRSHLPARRPDRGLCHALVQLLLLVEQAGPAQPIACVWGEGGLGGKHGLCSHPGSGPHVNDPPPPPLRLSPWCPPPPVPSLLSPWGRPPTP